MTTPINYRFIFLTVLFLAIGSIFRLWLWWHPVEKLLTWTILDDGFYYFTIARNITKGLGSTFDGIQLTNGYHPLWMAINVLVFTTTKNDLNAIHIIILLEALSGILAGTALAYLAVRLSNRHSLGMIVFILWMLNYRSIAFMQNGLETGISVLLLVLSILGAYSLMRNQSKNAQLVFGLLCGLTILARTDNIIFVGLLYLAIFAYTQSLKPLLLPTGVIALLLVPWFLWNYRHFHTILQTSATAITHALKLRLEEQSGAPPTISIIATYLIPNWLQTITRTYSLTALPVGPFAPLSVLWLTGAAIIAIRSFQNVNNHMSLKFTNKPDSNLLILGVLGVWPLLFITIHIGWRWYFRSYYYASLLPSVTFYFGILLWLLLKNKILGRLWVMLLVPLMLLSTYQFIQSPLYRHQSTMLDAAFWLNEHARECPVTGAFNAGIIGFFYTEGTIVNLDGVVNNKAAGAISEQALGYYTKQAGIVCLADRESYPSELLKIPEWGEYRPSNQSILLWQKQHPYSPTIYRRIYQIVWPSPKE